MASKFKVCFNLRFVVVLVRWLLSGYDRVRVWAAPRAAALEDRGAGTRRGLHFWIISSCAGSDPSNCRQRWMLRGVSSPLERELCTRAARPRIASEFTQIQDQKRPTSL